MLDQFIAKYNGKTKGYPTDSDYLGECLSIVKLYVKECFGINPPPSGTNSAYGYWTNFPSPLGEKFEKVANTPTGVPQKGDIIIWKPWTENKYGHIAIFVDGNTNSFNSFDQNWGGKQAHIQNHNYTNVIGWLHPKQNATGDEMIPENLLRGELFQYNGKPEVYWHIPNPEAFAKYVARTDLIEFRAEPEKIVEKPVDRPETLQELEDVREKLSKANKTIITKDTEIETISEAKKKAVEAQATCLKSKAELFGELDNVFDKNFLIQRDFIKKVIHKLTKLINKLFNK